MKRLILNSVVLVLCCLACGYLGYELGAHRTKTAIRSSAKWAAVNFSLDTAKKLRAGKVAEATADHEAVCFASATIVLSEPGWSGSFREMVGPSLLEYRRHYRTNRAEWTPNEQRLESLLAQKQRP